MKNNNYICHVPYLKSSKAYHNFWQTCVKLYLHMRFLNFGAVSGVKWQKLTQNEKLQLPSVACHISRTIQHMIMIFCTLVSKSCFQFYKNFDFLGCQWRKRAKNDPKLQKLSHSISQEPYLICAVFGTHVSNDDISPAIFSCFQNSDLFYF